jgi:hypothetical protein
MPVTAREGHLDKALTGVSIAAYDAAASDTIDAIFPVVGVQHQTDKYWTITKNDWLRIPNNERAPGAPSPRLTWSVSSDAYTTKNYGLAVEYPVEYVANAEAALSYRRSSAAIVSQTMVRATEERLKNLVSSGGNVGSGATLSGTAQWTDLTNSDPIGDVRTGQAYIESVTGLNANVGITTNHVLRTLARHPDLTELTKYTNKGLATADFMAEVFELDRIIVVKGIKENALEGGTSSLTNLWPNNFILAHVEPAAGLMTRTLGLQFRWTNPDLGTRNSVKVARYDEAGQNHTEAMEILDWMTEKIVAPELGYVIQDAI